MNKLLTAVLTILALVATRVVAQGEHPTRAASGHGQVSAEPGARGGDHAGSHAADRHGAGPVPPEAHQVWPGAVLIVIAFLFVVAIPVGIFARMHAPPDEPPPAHSHDEPPGTSHHHGASGTVNPEPYHGHASDHGHH